MFHYRCDSLPIEILWIFFFLLCSLFFFLFVVRFLVVVLLRRCGWSFRVNAGVFQWFLFGSDAGSLLLGFCDNRLFGFFFCQACGHGIPLFRCIVVRVICCIGGDSLITSLTSLGSPNWQTHLSTSPLFPTLNSGAHWLQQKFRC